MRPILDPWIEGYLDYQLKVRRLTPRSVVDVRCTLRRTVLMMEQIRPGVLLWKATLEDYLQWLNRKREAGYSTPSINKELSHLRGLLDYTWRSGRSDRNVLDGLTLEDRPRQQVPKHLTLEQARRLIEACPGSSRPERRDRLILLLLYGCGLRTSELCQLDLGDVDLERQELVVRHGKGERARRLPVPARTTSRSSPPAAGGSTGPRKAGITTRRPRSVEQVRAHSRCSGSTSRSPRSP